MNEMQSLSLNGKKYDSFRDQTARQQLEELKNNGNGSGQNGNGLTTAEKSAMLTLFKNIPYGTADMSATISELVALWTVNHSITYNLTNATSSNSASAITEGEAYKTTLTADKLYTLSGAVVEVTMGGVDITENAYSNGVITIASVTGDVVITVVAAEMAITDTTVVLDTINTGGLNRLGNTVSNSYVANASVSKAYDIGDNGANLQGVIFAGAETEVVTGLQSAMRTCLYGSDGAVLAYTSETTPAINNTGTEGKFSFVGGTTDGAAQVRFSIFTDYMDDSYAYFVNTGNIIFAGKNTPYYGMANIDGTMAEV